MLRIRETKTYDVIRRNIYVHSEDQEVWADAVLYAEKKRASLSAVVADALREYLKGKRK